MTRTEVHPSMSNTLHVVTPLWESQPLSTALGAPVFLKMEAFQPVGSFKARGMGAACRAAKASGARKLVCASGGNAGLAVAYAGRKLGLPTTIVVPASTSPFMRERIRAEGAAVLVYGDSWDDAHAHAVQLADAEGGASIHPFDDPQVWRGHAPLVHEIAVEGVVPGAVVVSVGGGGLLIGLLQGMHELGWTDVPVLAVETEGAASFAAATRAGRLVTLDRIDSIATTLGARTVAAEALAWTRRHPITAHTVTDRAAVTACRRFADDHRVLVEPACGASLSTVYDRAAPLDARSPVVVIVCGGAGASPNLLNDWERAVT